jgi:low affinity Fe/Cu permease
MPNYRPTNVGFRTKGFLMGKLEPASVSLVMGVFIVSIILSFLVGFILRFSLFWTCLFLIGVPNSISLYVVFFLIQGKPEGYLSDWYRSKIKGVFFAQVIDRLPRL